MKKAMPPYIDTDWMKHTGHYSPEEIARQEEINKRREKQQRNKQIRKSIINIVGNLFWGFLIAYCAYLAFFGAPRKICLEQWKDSGYSVTWEFIGGCKIQAEDGSYVPSSSIRILP